MHSPEVLSLTVTLESGEERDLDVYYRPAPYGQYEIVDIRTETCCDRQGSNSTCRCARSVLDDVSEAEQARLAKQITDAERWDGPAVDDPPSRWKQEA